MESGITLMMLRSNETASLSEEAFDEIVSVLVKHNITHEAMFIRTQNRPNSEFDHLKTFCKFIAAGV